MTHCSSCAPRTPALPGFVVYGAFSAWDLGEKSDPAPYPPIQPSSSQGTGMDSLRLFERVQMSSRAVVLPQRISMAAGLFERVQIRRVALVMPPPKEGQGSSFERVQTRGSPALDRAPRFPLRGCPSRAHHPERRLAMGVT